MHVIFFCFYITKSFIFLGGFYSAEDADSLPKIDSDHKVEGAFCVWTMKEIKTLLDVGEASKINGRVRSDLFSAYFNAKEGGNVNPRGDPHGELKNQNVLTLIGTDKTKIITAVPGLPSPTDSVSETSDYQRSTPSPKDEPESSMGN